MIEFLSNLGVVQTLQFRHVRQFFELCERSGGGIPTSDRIQHALRAREVILAHFSCNGAAFADYHRASLASSVASYFEKRRGLAIGIIFGSGPMLAAGVFSPILSTIIADHGWRAGYRSLAISGAVISTIMAIGLLRPAPSFGGGPAGPDARMPGTLAPGQLPGAELGEVLRSRTFWLIMLISVLMPITFGGATGHIVAMATETGQSANFGAAVLSAVFLGGVVAPVLAGTAADWFGTSKALLPFLALPALGFALLSAKVSGPPLLMAAVCIGLGFSAWTGQTPLLITRYFGLRSTGAVAGIVYATGGVALGVGPVLLGFLRSNSGSYASALVACLVAQLVSLGLAALLGPFASFVPPVTGHELLDSAPVPGSDHH